VAGRLVVFLLAAGINYLLSVYRPKMASRTQSVSPQRAAVSHYPAFLARCRPGLLSLVLRNGYH
jgi:hypothetical protein